MAKALITGITGQDGTYLSELLVSKGYKVHGLIRRNSNQPGNISFIPKEVKLHYGDLTTDIELTALIAREQFDEIYNLAAQSEVHTSFDIPVYTAEANAIGVTRLLEALKTFSPHTKYYQASTSELFGDSKPPQNENSPMVPNSAYANAKLYAFGEVRRYRRGYKMFGCNGILFNHESPRRGTRFVTRKITQAVARITYSLQDKLTLGNMDARRDWGYAKEYVEAMWQMLQAPIPDDFIIGTGEAHTVREFVKYTFDLQGLDWELFVESNSPAEVRPSDVNYLLADPSKARRVLNWQPKINFHQLIEIMLENDLRIAAQEADKKLFVKEAI